VNKVDHAFISTGEALDIYQIIEITKGSLAKGKRQGTRWK